MKSASIQHHHKPIGLRYGWIILAVLWVIGGVGIIQRLGWGHAFANYGSYVPWGLWVSAYIYFIGLSAGAFLLSSLVYVFRVHLLERVGPIALITAVVTLFLALISIWFDLGHLDRFYYVFTRPNFRSMMAWMVWLYTGYFILLISELYLVFGLLVKENMSEPSRRRWSVRRLLQTVTRPLNRFSREQVLSALRLLGTLGIPLAIAFHGGVGALFATVAARPTWHSPIYPIFFLTGALVSGGGLLMAIIAFLYPMAQAERRAAIQYIGRIVGALLIFDIILEWAEFSVPLWYGIGEEIETLRLILFGPYWWMFWVVHLLIGTAIPLVLLFFGKRTWQRGVAGLLIATTFLAVRLNLVIPEQLTPPLHQLRESFVDRRLQFEYVPSLHEWLVVVFLVAAGATVIYLANLLLHRWGLLHAPTEEVAS